MNINGTYEANSRYFAKYAAADIAQKVASHTNMNKDDVLHLLKPVTDEEILDIHDSWEKHIAKAGNRQTCATCGEIGLQNSKMYSFENVCINAFKVRISFAPSVWPGDLGESTLDNTLLYALGCVW